MIGGAYLVPVCVFNVPVQICTTAYRYHDKKPTNINISSFFVIIHSQKYSYRQILQFKQKNKSSPQNTIDKILRYIYAAE